MADEITGNKALGASATPGKHQKQNRGRFQKGQPRPIGAGRKPGTPNRITKTIKAVIESTFYGLQKDEKRNLLAFASKNNANLREFYKMAAKTIPIDAPLAKVDISLNAPPQDPEMAALEAARNLGWLLAHADNIKRDRTARALPAPEPVLRGADESAAVPSKPATETAEEPPAEPQEDYLASRSQDMQQRHFRGEVSAPTEQVRQRRVYSRRQR